MVASALAALILAGQGVILEPGHPYYPDPGVWVQPTQKMSITANTAVGGYTVRSYPPKEYGGWVMTVAADELVHSFALAGLKLEGELDDPNVAKVIWANRVSICANGPLETTPGFEKLPIAVKQRIANVPAPSGPKPWDGNMDSPAECGYSESFLYVFASQIQPITPEETLYKTPVIQADCSSQGDDAAGTLVVELTEIGMTHAGSLFPSGVTNTLHKDYAPRSFGSRWLQVTGPPPPSFNPDGGAGAIQLNQAHDMLRRMLRGEKLDLYASEHILLTQSLAMNMEFTEQGFIDVYGEKEGKELYQLAQKRLQAVPSP